MYRYAQTGLAAFKWVDITCNSDIKRFHMREIWTGSIDNAMATVDFTGSLMPLSLSFHFPIATESHAAYFVANSTRMIGPKTILICSLRSNWCSVCRSIDLHGFFVIAHFRTRFVLLWPFSILYGIIFRIAWLYLVNISLLFHSFHQSGNQLIPSHSVTVGAFH